ncbi:hypothetical protein [Aeromicrobium sp.]|uniref:hypothetical protein n=1 Tax=Aeromicrobium sp. TaxID=1871063 RepID=UPI002FCBD9CC
MKPVRTLANSQISSGFHRQACFDYCIATASKFEAEERGIDANGDPSALTVGGKPSAVLLGLTEETIVLEGTFSEYP